MIKRPPIWAAHSRLLQDSCHPVFCGLDAEQLIALTVPWYAADLYPVSL